MLKKLIRHEWRETWKIPALINLVLILLTVVLSLVLDGMEPAEGALDGLNMGAFFLFMGGVLAISSVSILISIYIAVRFYKHLFTDEGYLMHTLPVKPSMLLLSKLIIASVWSILNGIIVMIAMVPLMACGMPAMVVGMPEISTVMLMELLKAVGITGWDIAFFILILIPVGTVSGILMIYAAICIGQLFTKHKVMAAILSYIGISTLLQGVATAAMLPAMAGIILGQGSAADPMIIVNTAMRTAYLLTSVISLGISVFCYLLCRYVMGKCLNLD